MQFRSVYYLGEKFEVVVVSQGRNGERIWTDDHKFYVYPVTTSQASVKRAVQRWMRSRAEQYTLRAVAQFSKQMGVVFNTIRFRNQRTRWGSCSSNGALSFNWNLIAVPSEVFDYVVIHELAHIKHMNHSGSFWSYVAQFDPAYKTRKRWLRNHSQDIHRTMAWLS